MVIDFHTHIFTDSLAERAIANLEVKGGIKAFLNGTKADLLRSMDNAGIDISVIQPVLTKPSQTKVVNKWAAEIIDDRIKAFAGFHPKDENYKETIKEIKQMGFKGVKIHPDYQDVFVDDPQYFKVFSEIFEKGLAILFHAGLDIGFNPPYHCTPERLNNLTESIETGTIIAAHLGGHSMWEDVKRVLCGKDIYFDTSTGTRYYGENQLLRIIKLHGENKILFATDSPWDDQKDELGRIKAIIKDEQVLEKILYKNALNLI